VLQTAGVNPDSIYLLGEFPVIYLAVGYARAGFHLQMRHPVHVPHRIRPPQPAPSSLHPYSGCVTAVTTSSHGNKARKHRSLSPSWSRVTSRRSVRRDLAALFPGNPADRGAVLQARGCHGNQTCNQDAVACPWIPETQRDSFAAFPLVDGHAVIRVRPRETRR
jgi:hypothetical protein